jgi:serine acetyltransferase
MLTIFKEIKKLKGNSKGIFFIIAFRTSNFFSKNIILKIIGFPIRTIYKIFFQWILGFDIPDSTSIGFGFNVYHGQSLIINENTIIGENVIVRHNTTIGNAIKKGGAPIIGNNVNIGTNVCIIGDIKIGDNVKIGCGSIVVKDVPPNCTIVGNPARIIRYMNSINLY